jgi:peptidoglycan hydrolase CwlO-like protein
VKINQSIIKEVKNDVIELRKDIDKINEKITFIYNYIVKKKEKEDARWF